jgi:hypothetical protein
MNLWLFLRTYWSSRETEGRYVLILYKYFIAALSDICVHCIRQTLRLTATSYCII